MELKEIELSHEEMIRQLKLVRQLERHEKDLAISGWCGSFFSS